MALRKLPQKNQNSLNDPKVVIRVHQSSYQKDTLRFKEIIVKSRQGLIEYLKKIQYSENDVYNLVRLYEKNYFKAS